MSVESLAARIGFGTRECGRAVAELQRRYLVDLVSGLEGRAVKETLRLTEDGESSLMNSLEKMCELPELPSD